MPTTAIDTRVTVIAWLRHASQPINISGAANYGHLVLVDARQLSLIDHQPPGPGQRAGVDGAARLQAAHAGGFSAAAAAVARAHDDSIHLVGLPVLVGTACGARPAHQGGARHAAGTAAARQPARAGACRRHARHRPADIAARRGFAQRHGRRQAPVAIPLESIQAPTLVISARDDRYGTDASAQYAASRIAGARFIGFDKGGHVWVGHDDEVLAAIAGLLVVPAR